MGFKIFGITFGMGDKIDFFAGVLSAFVGVGIVGILSTFLTINNIWFLILAFIFSMILLYRVEQMVRRVSKENVRDIKFTKEGSQ